MVIGLLLSFFMVDASANELPSIQDSNAITRVVISCEESLKKDHDDYYYSNLLKLALDKTIDSHGPYQLKFTPVMPITNRLLLEIERGSIDITWMPFERHLKYDLKPIPIRLLKNLSDYRVFLIRADNQQTFFTIKTLADLRKLKGGIGSHWPDRQIMEENGLPLVLSMSYFNLFKMLKSGRFDYFSRGVFQVKSEVEAYADKGIALEKNLFLRYENPVYFYVHKNNTRLAERIEAGLKIALDDGSFNALFNQMDNFKWGEQLLVEHDRTVIQLNTF